MNDDLRKWNDPEDTALMLAAKGYCPRMLDAFVDGEDFTEILNEARENGTAGTVRRLFCQLSEGAKADERDRNGKTALMYAAKRFFIGDEALRDDTLEVMGLLISHGADVNAQDNFGNTALTEALTCWKNEVSSWYLIRYDDCPGFLFDEAKEAAENKSINIGDNSAIKFLLDNGADINAGNSQGTSPLMTASGIQLYYSYRDYLDESRDHLAEYRALLELLISRGADVNARNDDGLTVLMMAYPEEPARILLENGAEVDARDSKGMTALMRALANNSSTLETVKIFTEAGADVNIQDERGFTALMYASYRCDSYNVERLLEAGALPDIRDEKGRTALMMSRGLYSAKIVERLAKYGADVNARDEMGRTALIFSAGVDSREWLRSPDLAMMNALLENGAEPNITDNNGDTALMYLASILSIGRRGLEVRQCKAAKLLLEHGAETAVSNNNGFTALDLAIKRQTSERFTDLLRR